MGFVHLVKEHHCAGTLLQQLGQLTPVLMSNVTGRGADKLGHLRVKKNPVKKLDSVKVSEILTNSSITAWTHEENCFKNIQRSDFYKLLEWML